MKNRRTFFPNFLFAASVLATLTACGSLEVGTTASKPKYNAQKTEPALRAGQIRVEKGDTVYGLSRQHDIPVRALIDRNGLKAPFHLYVGQILTLPNKNTYRVKKGDTLFSVSRQHNTDVYSLAKTNNLPPPYTLYAGQVLKLPFANVQTAAAPKTVSRPQAAPSASQEAKRATLSQFSTPPRVAGEPSLKPSTVGQTPQRIAKAPIPKPPARSSSRFSWPVSGKIVSSFGTKKTGLRNDGINILAKRGTPVKAAENGVVAYSGNELRGFGNMLLIKHSDGWITAYAHNERLLVKRGQKVRKGQPIASVGSSGGVTEPQLHFEIRKGMNPVNPKKYLGG